MSGTWLIPNIGAEEGLARDDDGSEPAEADAYARAAQFADPNDPVLQSAGLWRMLFGADARFVGADRFWGASREPARGSASFWPAEWGERDDSGPAFAWLATPAAAWLNTRRAAQRAGRHDCALLGADPDVVRVVHDKAFAHRVATAAGWLPSEIASAIEPLEPDALRTPGAAHAWVIDSVRRWPDWMDRRFVLKPRFGTSGRGRVAGSGDQIAVGRTGFARLASTGGAMLEPWLQRTVDLSAQMWIEPDGQLVLLGTTELVVERSGLYRGHRGIVDHRGRVGSGSRFDETLREAAIAIGRAAFEHGYWGPCGVDAFAFRADGVEVFRPIVEFNARFTLGTVVIGLLRRSLRWIRSALALDPGEVRAFGFALRAPDGWDPSPDTGVFLPLSGSGGPGLVVASDPEVVDSRFGVIETGARAQRAIDGKKSR